MGFNFGAFLGGAASQIVEDIDEQEREVKLRTRTILDRQVAEAAENRKKFQDDKEKVEKQITSIAQLFDPNDPFRFNKARSIVAGGDEHYNTMYKELSTHKRLGGDMSKAYDYTAANEEQGFQGVADAAKGLAKLRTISAPDFSESVRSEGAKLFGIDPSRAYTQARAQYEQAGLLPSTKEEFQETVQKYGTGTINFQNLKKDVKDVQGMYANNTQAIIDLDPNDPNFAQKRKKLEDAQKIITKQVANMNNVSATVLATKLREEGDKDKGQTLTEMKNLYKDARNKYEKSLQYSKTDGILNDDGERIFDEEAKQYFDNKMNAWDKDYVSGLVDGKGNLIDDSADSQSFLKAFDLQKYVGTPKEKEDITVPEDNKIKAKEILIKQAKEAGTPEIAIQQLLQQNVNIPEKNKAGLYQRIFEYMQEAYPDNPNMQSILNKEINNFNKLQNAKKFVRTETVSEEDKSKGLTGTAGRKARREK
tara:strand:+ start:655 stop:2088 length:1434 start_codon:yes stop_codon:yes gene_type:complete